jgi:hypothetical protein
MPTAYGATVKSNARRQSSRRSLKLGFPPRKWLEKKSRVGFRGYPVGTIAFYGPDDRRASKVVVGIIPANDAEATELRDRWTGATLR